MTWFCLYDRTTRRYHECSKIVGRSGLSKPFPRLYTALKGARQARKRMKKRYLQIVEVDILFLRVVPEKLK